MCLATLGTAPTNYPADLVDPLGGAADMQVLDIYNQRTGGGVYLHPASEPARAKYFVARKVSSEQQFAVVHHRVDRPFEQETIKRLYDSAFNGMQDAIGIAMNYQLDAEILPGDSFSSPKVAIGIHNGGFHEALRAYRRWANTWFKRPYPVPEWHRHAWWIQQPHSHTATQPHSLTASQPEFILQPHKRLIEEDNPIRYDVAGMCFLTTGLSNWESTLNAIDWKRGKTFSKDLSALIRFNQQLRAGGIRNLCWCSGFLMGRRREDKSFMPEEGLEIVKDWAIQYDGKYVFYVWGMCEDMRDPSEGPWVCICIAAPGFTFHRVIDELKIYTELVQSE